MADGPPDDKSLEDAARRARERSKRPRAQEVRTTVNVDSPQDGTGGERAPDALGEALVARGLISRHKLFNALNESYREGCTLREALVKLGYLAEEELEQLEEAGL